LGEYSKPVVQNVARQRLSCELKVVTPLRHTAIDGTEAKKETRPRAESAGRLNLSQQFLHRRTQ